MARSDTRSDFSFEKLEPRILLSADALGGAVGSDLFTAADETFSSDGHQDEKLESLATGLVAQYGSVPPASLGLAALDLDGLGEFTGAGASGETRHELIFIDESVGAYETLLQDLMSGDGSTEYSVIVLNGNSDGVEQISDALGGMENLDAIHVLSHGAEGRVQLGASWLDNTSLADNRAAIAGWGNALSDGADILIYGCNLAGNAEGLALVDSLVELTGADVAGSDDLTGSVALG